jgi:hypothetical protein
MRQLATSRVVACAMQWMRVMDITTATLGALFLIAAAVRVSRAQARPVSPPYHHRW